ncbi:hypothetical protein [Amycolatopsis orientalis]|uniref:hypothetical protein n=1 Tax=Amycolatopsis orientalis TaxID=31958 RepID=UPI00126854F5|nr:hypothetical protein [Amycolatopsis orientalis]
MIVEYQSRAGSQVVVGMVMTAEVESPHIPDSVRRSWYAFAPTEQLSLDAPPVNAADMSFDDVASRVRATPVEESGPNWFSSHDDLHTHLYDLGFPIDLYNSRGGTRNLWRCAERGFGRIDRELLREVIPAGIVDRLARRVEACHNVPSDALDALRADLFAVAQEVLSAFQTVGQLAAFSSSNTDGPIVEIHIDSVSISHPPDALVDHLTRLGGHLTSSARYPHDVEDLVLDALEQMFGGDIEFGLSRHSTTYRSSSVRMLSGHESFLATWAYFLVMALIKSGQPAQRDGDVVGTLFLDEHIWPHDDPIWLSRAFNISRAMGFQVVLTASDLNLGLAAVDVVIGVRTESANQVRKAAVATHTRTGIWGSHPQIGNDPGEEVMEHVPLTDVFRFVSPNDHPIGESALGVGDIALSTFVTPLAFGPVVREDRIMTDALVVLRPVRELDQRERLFYRRYFNSEAFTARFVGSDGIAWLRPWNLSGLRIPRPDKATLHALSELTSAARQFSLWSHEAEHAVHSYFKWDNVAVARSHMIDAGRLTRQRREAGSLIDARDSRLRTTLPFPLATRWRAVQAAPYDHSAYTLVLECAEAVLAYCAVLGLVLARADGLPLGPLRQQANRFAKGGSGPTFGTWGTIVSYFATAKPFRGLPADSPLVHFAGLARPEVSEAIAANKRRRDHNAHRRRPSPHETRSAVEDAKNDLLILLEAVEWLVDFPLRHIERSRWDTFEKLSHLSFRELMGDHNVVPLHDGTVDHIIEADSPYAVDQFGRYHLLRPFFVSLPCDKCGQLTVFVIDAWDPTTETATYLALDHAHTIELANQRGTLEQVGLLPPPTVP